MAAAKTVNVGGYLILVAEVVACSKEGTTSALTCYMRSGGPIRFQFGSMVDRDAFFTALVAAMSA